MSHWEDLDAERHCSLCINSMSGPCDDCRRRVEGARLSVREPVKRLPSVAGQLEYYLRIYIHAHEHGNSVPPHIDAEARKLVNLATVRETRGATDEPASGCTQCAKRGSRGLDGLCPICAKNLTIRELTARLEAAPTVYVDGALYRLAGKVQPCPDCEDAALEAKFAISKRNYLLGKIDRLRTYLSHRAGCRCGDSCTCGLSAIMRESLDGVWLCCPECNEEVEPRRRDGLYDFGEEYNCVECGVHLLVMGDAETDPYMAVRP